MDFSIFSTKVCEKVYSAIYLWKSHHVWNVVILCYFYAADKLVFGSKKFL